MGEKMFSDSQTAEILTAEKLKKCACANSYQNILKDS